MKYKSPKINFSKIKPLLVVSGLLFGSYVSGEESVPTEGNPLENGPNSVGNDSCINGDEPTECTYSHKYIGCPKCFEEYSGAGQDSSGESFVSNGQLEYNSWAYDFSLPGSVGGCSPCGSGGGSSSSSLASLEVKRYFKSRFETHWLNSFGRMESLAEYDTSLKWREHSVEPLISMHRAGAYNASMSLKWTSRLTWATRGVDKASFGLTLYDAAGTAITAYADRDLAHTGVFLEPDGSSIHFELIRKADMVYGRWRGRPFLWKPDYTRWFKTHLRRRKEGICSEYSGCDPWFI